MQHATHPVVKENHDDLLSDIRVMFRKVSVYCCLFELAPIQCFEEVRARNDMVQSTGER